MDKRLVTFYQERNRLLQKAPPVEMEAFLLSWQHKFSQTEDWQEWTAVAHDCGLFYRSMGQFTKSIAVLQQVGQVVCRKKGRNSSEYAALLNNLAGTCRLAGDALYAVQLFKEALHIYQQQKQVNVWACGRLYSNLSQTYQEIGEWQQSAESLERALQYMRLSGKGEELGPEYHNLALLYHRAGNDAEAARCIEKALAEFSNHNQEKNPRYARALNSLGAMLYQSRHYEKAARVYNRAAAYLAKFYGKNHDYAVNRQHEAWALRGAGQLQAAYDALLEAAEICATIYGDKNERVQAVKDELRQLGQQIARSG